MTRNAVTQKSEYVIVVESLEAWWADNKDDIVKTHRRAFLEGIKDLHKQMSDCVAQDTPVFNDVMSHQLDIPQVVIDGRTFSLWLNGLDTTMSQHRIQSTAELVIVLVGRGPYAYVDISHGGGGRAVTTRDELRHHSRF